MLELRHVCSGNNDSEPSAAIKQIGSGVSMAFGILQRGEVLADGVGNR